MNTLELNKEKEKLNKTIEIIKEVLNEENIELKVMFETFKGDREELWRITDRKKIHIKNLESSLDRPYFARMDFTYEKDGKTLSLYIGKNGIMRDSDIIVTDWRAPISSLYYDSNIGKTSYESPSGTYNVDLQLKRQFEIELGELLGYYDVDIVSQDDLLQKYLNTNNDARLKSIVSTIQKEQNEAIRQKIEDDIIVQGVAGSGKTTVALHRIAYLVYNYMNNINQNQYLVIGPNPTFLKYIKSVLPDLDVSGVTQATFEQFTMDYIDEQLIINSSEKKINDSINKKNSFDIDSFKCSMGYKEMLDVFLNTYFHSITQKDLVLGDFKILDSNSIKDVFNDHDLDYTDNLQTRVNIVMNRLIHKISNKSETLLSEYIRNYYEMMRSDIEESKKQELIKRRNKDTEEIKKGCRTIVKKYFSKVSTDISKLYKEFVSNIEDYNINDYKDIKTLKSRTLKNLKSNNYDFEDLAALLYIKSKISPNKRYLNIRQTVIDEAQDLGEFNFYVIKCCMSKSSFSIFGDLAQSIYDYRGIKNWDSVNSNVFDNKAKIINFNKSYRTTAEIMNAADNIAESIGYNRSEMVIRHGNKVNYTHVSDADAMTDHIIQKIEEYKSKGYKTIAIISKTDYMSAQINYRLYERGITIPNISYDDDLNDPKNSVCTISNQLSKGLEFDAVIINDASENIYSSKSSLDMKLLYVAVTRALHELDIVHSKVLTKPLQKENMEIENQRTLIKK